MTLAVLPWLPDRHLGVVSTLTHADELISQVGDLLSEYLTQSDGVITLREVPEGAVSNTVIEGLAPIPKKVPLLVADTLVTLRAAIEHTLFAELEFINGGTLDEKQAQLVEMPASLKYANYSHWLNGRSGKFMAAADESGALMNRVESLQPFHRNIRPDLHPLARLTSHTNHAKHRTPAITAVRLAAIIRDDETPRSIRDVSLRPDSPLQIGDIIARTPLGQRIPATLFPTIGIRLPRTDNWPILMHELDELSCWVRKQAIPRLISGGEPPADVIPASYDIQVGHSNERKAIALGSSLTAAERNKSKLGAASARESLVGILLQVSADLTPEGLTTWLEQLRDEEVLDRADRLKAQLTQDPGKGQKALLTLAEEALQFVEN